MPKREYILTTGPETWSSGRVVRVVKERTDDGPWREFLAVASDDAMDVLAALRRAYQDGREDRAGEMEAGR